MVEPFWTGWTPQNETSVHLYVWARKTKLIPVKHRAGAGRQGFLLAALDPVRLAFAASTAELDDQRLEDDFFDSFEPILKSVKRMAGMNSRILGALANLPIKRVSVSTKHLDFDYTHRAKVRRHHFITSFETRPAATFPPVARRFWTQLYDDLHATHRKLINHPGRPLAEVLDARKRRHTKAVREYLRSLRQ